MPSQNYLTKRNKPADESPARDDVRSQHLIGRMDDAADKPDQFRDEMMALR